MSKVVTMGEIMLRLSTPNFERFIEAERQMLLFPLPIMDMLPNM